MEAGERELHKSLTGPQASAKSLRKVQKSPLKSVPLERKSCTLLLLHNVLHWVGASIGHK